MRRFVYLAVAVSVALLAGMIGCRTPAPVYQPTASLSIEEAKQVIARSLEEQARGFAAGDIRVTDEKLSFARDRSSFLGIGGNTVLTTFYFDSLGKMSVTLKSKGHVVRVWDSGDAVRFLVVIPSEDRARRFMDAMLVMSRNVEGEH